MICEKCVKTKPIPLCIDALTIGKAEPSTMYRIWFENMATGALYDYFVMSDNNGIISLSLFSGFVLASYTGFKMWINKSGSSTDTKEELLVGANVGYCFIVSAVKTQSLNYSYDPSPNVSTLEVE